jgi:hypothetical protein
MKSKSPEKKKTLRLKVDNDIRYRLIGISCHENDYRLVWAINNMLKMQFVRLDNLLVHNTKLNQDLEFSRYYYQDEDRYLTHYLISNRCPDGYLFPEIRKLDFLLRMSGEVNASDIENLIKGFRKIEIISAVYQIQPGSLRNIIQIGFD